MELATRVALRSSTMTSISCHVLIAQNFLLAADLMKMVSCQFADVKMDTLSISSTVSATNPVQVVSTMIPSPQFVLLAVSE